MGVYIRGMKMPKNHNHVTITIWSDGTASYALHDRKESLVDFRNVEAVPVPEHGRLIDADAIPYNKIMLEDDDFYYGVTKPYIDRMPTIIPADGDE